MEIKTLIKSFLFRFIVALLLVGGGSLLFIWQPYLQAQRVITSQKDELKQALKQIDMVENTLASLASPGRIATQNPPTSKQYAEEVKRAADAVSPIFLTLPSPIRTVGWIKQGEEQIDKVNAILRDETVKKTYERALRVVQDADQLLAFHAAMSFALANILDYNPSLDFLQFTPGDEDTTARIDRAGGGLQKSLDRLSESAALYNDSSVNDLEQSIKTLQQELDHLAQTGDLPRWKKVFAAEQVAIQTNRQAFWKKESIRLSEELISLERNLDETLQRYSKL